MTYYPSDETLKEIEEWEGNYHKLMEFIKQHLEASACGDLIYDDDEKHYVLRTGGWSGNESIIIALKANTLFWQTCWYQTTRGGMYTFEIRRNNYA